MNQIASAIGGAIDRATLALLWLGRGVFALAVLLGVYLIGVSAIVWCTIPATIPDGSQVFVRNAQSVTFDDLIPGAKPGELSFDVDMQDKSTIRVAAVDGAGAAAAAAKIWLERAAARERQHSSELLGAGLLSAIAGAIFLGLMRVMRWILTGR